MATSGNHRRLLDPGRRQFMRLHIRDILSSITWTTCDATARGIYMSLIMHSYLMPDGILRQSDEELCSLCNCTDAEWAKAFPRIRQKFVKKDMGIANTRVRAEIAYTIRRSRKGTTSINHRWHPDTNELRTNYEGNTNDIPRARVRAGSESSSEDSRDTSTGRLTPDSLVQMYNEVLPELPKVRVPISSGIRESVKTAIRRDGKDLDYWKSYFQSIREMPFLMGKKTEWKASLIWLLGPKNMAKVESGAYLASDGETNASDPGKRSFTPSYFAALGEKEFSPGFLKLWNSYPRQIGKREAFVAYCKKVLGLHWPKHPEKTFEEADAFCSEYLIGCVEDLLRTFKKEGREPDHYPYLETILNGKFWEDYEDDPCEERSNAEA